MKVSIIRQNKSIKKKEVIEWVLLVTINLLCSGLQVVLL